MTAELQTSPPPSDVTVRFVRDGDDEDVLRLLQRSFPRWPPVPVSVSPLEHLRWKMRLGEGDERRDRVAVVDGKIVAVATSGRRAALLRGRPVLTNAHGGDACVDPAYRELGIMTKMRQSRQPRSDLALVLVGIARHEAMIRLRRQSRDPRYVFANRVERFVCPLTLRSALAHYKLLRLRSPRKALRRVARLLRWLAARASERVPWLARRPAVRLVQDFDERADDLWRAAAPQFELIQARDRAYLSWRYADPRAGIFTILIAEDGRGTLLGYAVSTLDWTGRRALVADLLCLPGRNDAARALVAETIARARRAGARELVCRLPERHPYRSVLDGAGFAIKRRKDGAAFRWTGGVPEEDVLFLQDERASIHITFGDTDKV